LAWMRKGDETDRPVLCVINLTPVPRPGYRIGVPSSGTWEVILNSDRPVYGGSGAFELSAVEASGPGCHGQGQAVELDLPPLAVVALSPLP